MATDDRFAEVDRLDAERAARCRACPPGCRECAGSDCECCEHQELHPGNMQVEVDRLRAELADWRHNVAQRAFTPPDADLDTVLSSLDSRIASARAEATRLRRERNEARNMAMDADEALIDARAEIDRLHTWQGLMAILDKHWPATVFPTLEDDVDRDTGPRIVSLLRWVDKLRAEVDELTYRAETAEENLQSLVDNDAKWHREGMQRDAITRRHIAKLERERDIARAERDQLAAAIARVRALAYVPIRTDNDFVDGHDRDYNNRLAEVWRALDGRRKATP
jgi:hypothetical protein